MNKEDIIDKQFSRAFRGYDIAEVDRFLDALYRELEIGERERELMQLRIELLTATLDKHGILLPAEQVDRLRTQADYITALADAPIEEPEEEVSAEALISEALSAELPPEYEQADAPEAQAPPYGAEAASEDVEQAREDAEAAFADAPPERDAP